MTKSKVTLWPSEESFEIRQDMTLLEALKKEGYPIKSSCGGCASCSDCVIIIKSGEDNLSPQKFEELRLLGNVFHITKERLSCQTKVNGPISIDIRKHILSGDSQMKEEKKKTTVRKKNEVQEHKKKRELEREEYKKQKDEKAKERGGLRRPKPFRVDDES